MGNISVILVSIAVFTALVLYLTINQDNREKWVGFAFSIAALSGLTIYGLSYSRSPDPGIVEVLRTVIDTGRMFAGMNNVAVFTEVVGEGSPWLILFWSAHFLAYYSMASVFILVLGKSAISKFRSWLLRINDVELIYGINKSSLEYGRTVAEGKRVSVVFVDTDAMKWESDIRQIGALIYSDPSALNPDKKLLKRLGVKKGKGKFHLTALSDNADQNFDYAKKLLSSLEKANINPEQTGITIIGREEMEGIRLLASPGYYGYGQVKVFEKTELIARLLLQKFPLCDVVEFDDEAKAHNGIEIVLIGFGRLGQESLKKLVANGQFEGSSFKVRVFDPNFHNIDGYYHYRYKTMLETYDIEFFAADGRSRQLTDYILENAETINYVVTAVGDNELGREIATNILDLFHERKRVVPVYQCTSDSVWCYKYGEERKIWSLNDADILYGGKMDDRAKEINHYYCGEEGDVDRQWAECDYFSRMSCRASADFLTALFKRLEIVGKDSVSPEVLENLARTEHLRWSAFHYSMGFSGMTPETLKERAELFKTDTSIRITKDMAGKQHACLIPWEELDALSDFENKITGKNVDYKQMDRDNINVMISLLAKVKKK
ncbi:hypothetical protein [Butyrivibrio sp. MC2021]|uniref:hypothetical protein n=1 Tax=Butyrivibrio sp. MC2021 TaxID=1408306 RepID=UPI00047A078E|nr:hypothetical protein [Butyrivibrio sp. MC2021]